MGLQDTDGQAPGTQHTRITVVEKKRVWIIDVAIPGDGRIEEKELEKIKIPRSTDRNRKTVGKTSHCSTSSDRIIRCNTKRP